MAKTKYFAIDASGAEHTRSSGRVYSHTVVYLLDKSDAMRNATDKRMHEMDASNFEYYTALASGNHAHVTRVTGREGYHVSYTDEQVAEFQERQRQENARLIQQSKAMVGDMTVYEYIAMKEAERVARVESTDYSIWHNAGWCGRHDLAHKLAAMHIGSRYAAVAILPAFTR